MAVGFDARTAAWVTGTTSPQTLSLTTSASATAIAVILMSGNGSALPTLTVKWDTATANQSFTLVPTTTIGDANLSASGAIYGLVSPTTSGAKNITITMSPAGELHACAISFTGTDVTSVAVAFPHGNSATAASGTTSSVTITSAVNNMVIAGHFQNVGSFSAVNNTQITTAPDNSGPNIGVAANRASGAATVAMTATFSPTGRWDSFGCDVLAAAGAAGYIPYNPWPQAGPMLAT